MYEAMISSMGIQLAAPFTAIATRIGAEVQRVAPGTGHGDGPMEPWAFCLVMLVTAAGIIYDMYQSKNESRGHTDEQEPPSPKDADGSTEDQA